MKKLLPPHSERQRRLCSINLKDGYLFDSSEIAIKDSFWYYAEEPPNNSFFDVVYQDEMISCVDTNAFNKKDCAASDLHLVANGENRSALRYKALSKENSTRL